MRFRPSKAYQWSNCAASTRISAGRPDDSDTNDAAKEGTCAAWVAETVLCGDAHECRDLVGRNHANGWFVTEEMADDVQAYVDLIRKRGGNTKAEHFVILSIMPDISGTLDATSDTTGREGLLYVDDLKYGRKVVEIYENPQLIIYGAARARTFEPGTIKRVQLGIYQPRAFHVDGIYRRWVLSIEELEQRAVALIAAARAGLDPNATATPGKWCGHCAGAAACEAIAQTSYAVLDRVQSSRFRDRTALELAHDLDFVAEAKDVLDAFSKAMNTEAEQRMKRAEFVPGWIMAPKKGNRAFNVDPFMIRAYTGVDPYMPAKVCTPAELERRGADPEKIAQISTRADIGVKLTRLTDNTIAGYFRDRGNED